MLSSVFSPISFYQQHFLQESFITYISKLNSKYNYIYLLLSWLCPNRFLILFNYRCAYIFINFPFRLNYPLPISGLTLSGIDVCFGTLFVSDPDVVSGVPLLIQYNRLSPIFPFHFFCILTTVD